MTTEQTQGETGKQVRTCIIEVGFAWTKIGKKQSSNPGNLAMLQPNNTGGKEQEPSTAQVQTVSKQVSC